MTDERKAELERALSLGLAVVAALVAVTCGSRGTLEHGPIAPLSPPPSAANAGASGLAGVPRPASSRSPEPAALSAEPSANSPGAAAPKADPTRLALPRFYADLAALEQKQRSKPVRILWLGDSHTAADFLTGSLRTRLQARFGAGGPGFVRVGLKPYRHSQVHWSCDGPWKIEPVPPPRRTPFDDGVFGLGGIRAYPDGAPAVASFELGAGAARGRLGWQLWYSLPEGASFRVTVGGVSQVVTHGTAASELPGAGFSSLALDSAAPDKLELLTLGGAPRFYGLIAEGAEPGLVLDAVGIDGARVATALAWGEGSFEAAVRAREPSLVAIAFGTNEAFDADKPEKYRPQYQALLTRVRAAAPNVDCLIVGPPDANAVAGGSEPRVAELDALQRSVAGDLGCGYLSQLEIMGGPGSYSRWSHQTPALAKGDRLHLSAKGYDLVANAIADRLLAAYEQRAAKSVSQ
ncbi:MAG: GDSL-type esterase/lipase family protein [Myxococcales bacterium]